MRPWIQLAAETRAKESRDDTHILLRQAERLREELGKPGYVCSTITIGANTDPYQPVEREWKITRSILQVIEECTLAQKQRLAENPTPPKKQ